MCFSTVWRRGFCEILTPKKLELNLFGTFQVRWVCSAFLGGLFNVGSRSLMRNGEVAAGWTPSDWLTAEETALITHCWGPTSIRRRWSHFLQPKCSDSWSRKLHLTFQFSFSCQFPSLMTLWFLSCEESCYSKQSFPLSHKSLNMLQGQRVDPGEQLDMLPPSHRFFQMRNLKPQRSN